MTVGRGRRLRSCKHDPPSAGYFRKYGFQDVTLTLLILEPGSSFEMAVELEQYCMDILSPKLNPRPYGHASMTVGRGRRLRSCKHDPPSAGLS